MELIEQQTFGQEDSLIRVLDYGKGRFTGKRHIYKFTKKYTLTDMNVCLCVCVY